MNDDEHCNVESSLLILFIIRNLVYVQFLLQVAHLQSCSPSSRVVSSMKCVLQVVRHTEHIALNRTIVYCHVTGSIMGCSLRVKSAGVAG